MKVELTAGTLQRLALLFAPEDQGAAATLLLKQCGDNLPLIRDTDPRVERIRFAVMKLSGGKLAALQRAIDLAKIDWRDVLVAAGFGDDPKAHESWWPQ